MKKKTILNNLRIKIANSYIISSVSITFVLLVLGSFSLLLLNTKDLSNTAKQSIKISVILKPDAEAAKINSLQNKISLADYCDELNTISPDEAMDMIKEDLGEDIDNMLTYNPLPTTFNITLAPQYTNTDSLQIIAERLKKNDIVSDVFYNRSLVYQLDKNIKKLTVATAILEFFLLLMVVALIGNTVRLMIYSKRFEIKTMQLVGATRGFIMRPFIIKAFWHGFISSLIAIGLMIFAILYYQNKSEDIIKISHLETSFAVVILAGLIITIGATYVSVLSFLNSDEKTLYEL